MTYVIISIILNTISDLSIPVLSVIKTNNFGFHTLLSMNFREIYP